MPSAEGSFSHLRPLPIATPGVQYHRGLGLFGDSLYYPIQWVESKDETTWELVRGLGYSGSSLPSCPSLSSDNLLYREDFPGLKHGVGMAWVRSGSSVGHWRLEGIRFWKISRTYSGEKPPSLSVLTHSCCLTTRKPTRHLLVMPNILVRIGVPYEGRCFYSVPSAQELWHHL